MLSFAFNIAIAAAWAALVGPFDLLNLIIGYGVGATVLATTDRLWDGGTYLRRGTGVVRLVVWGGARYVASSLSACGRAVWPARTAGTSRLELPVSLDRDGEVTALALLIAATGASVPAGITSDTGNLVIESRRRTRTHEQKGQTNRERQRERHIERRLRETLR